MFGFFGLFMIIYVINKIYLSSLDIFFFYLLAFFLWVSLLLIILSFILLRYYSKTKDWHKVLSAWSRTQNQKREEREEMGSFSRNSWFNRIRRHINGYQPRRIIFFFHQFQWWGLYHSSQEEKNVIFFCSFMSVYQAEN